MEGVAEIFTQGMFLVDFLPVLRHIARWTPGAEFQRKAAKWRIDTMALKDVPWQSDLMNHGPYPSIATKMLDCISHLEGEAHAREEIIAKNVCGAAYAAGADTTVSALHVFFLAMILYSTRTCSGERRRSWKRSLGRQDCQSLRINSVSVTSPRYARNVYDGSQSFPSFFLTEVWPSTSMKAAGSLQARCSPERMGDSSQP